MDTVLLKTKLKRPPVTPDLVARPRLVMRLNERPERGLTVISAPAGYGKSTLLSEWCETQPLPVAWVSLDVNDNHPHLFLRYVVAALRAHQPNAFAELDGLIAAPQQTYAQVLVTSFVNQIDEWGQRIILVLDDYHLIQEKAPRDFLSILIQNLPPNLHLVLAARTDPVLPLARARVQGNLVELRMADLRFTPAEVESFLHSTLNADIDPTQAALIDKRVEGWAAGLRLASLSLRGLDSFSDAGLRISGTGRLMTEYLVDQVLLQQTQEVQEFLLRTCLVDRFSLPLAQVLLDDVLIQPDRVLEEIERANLFLIPLDDEHTWFRYHPLFQELLRARVNRQLGKVRIAALEAKASVWFENNGQLEEAIEHALKAGDPLSAARLIEANAHVYFNREDSRSVERWLGLIPAEVISERPLLQMVRAWIWWMQWRFEVLAPFLDELEGRLDRGELDPDSTTESLVRGYVYTLQAQFAYWRADVEPCIRYSERALELVPANHRFLRGLIYFFYANGLVYLGNASKALALLDRVLEQDGYRSDQFTTRLLLAKQFIHLTNDQLPESIHVGEALLNLARKENLLESAGWANNGLGRAFFELNRLDLALPHFAEVVELRATANARAAHGGFVGLALTYQAMGLSEQANQVAASARAFALETQLPTLPYVNSSFEARLALMQGDLKTAVQRADTLSRRITPTLFGFIEVPDLTKLHVLIAEGSRVSLVAAEQLCGELAEFCERTHSTYYTTTMLAFGALLHAAQGRDSDALTILEAAIEAARSSRRIRTFTDMGKPMFDLLQKLAPQLPGDKYIRELLATFESPVALPGNSPDATTASPSGPKTMANPLTRREFQVLELLRDHLSNNEIGQKLFISPLTVDKHTQNIYSKLGVNNRRTAVETAIQLGILTH